MSTDTTDTSLTEDQKQELAVKVGKAFRPTQPIGVQELFAGRLDQITLITGAITQPGLNVVLFGERGVGKTSLANIVPAVLHLAETSIQRLIVKANVVKDDSFSDTWKRAFDKVTIDQDKIAVGFDAQVEKTRKPLRSAWGISEQPSIDEVRNALAALSRSVFIFDEFDRGSADMKTKFTDLIKTLSDDAIESTIIIVGVSETIGELLEDHASIGRSIVQIHLPRMREEELYDVLKKASHFIGTSFEGDAAKLIVNISQGLPHFTHLIGLYSTTNAIRRGSSTVSKDDVVASFKTVVQNSEQSIRDQYEKATRNFRKGSLYEEVLLACATAAAKEIDSQGYFHAADVVAPLKKILNRQSVQIATFQRHLNEFCEEKRGFILQRTGAPRAYKYRFSNPLMPPFVFIKIGGENINLLY